MYKFELAASLAGYTNLEMGALSFTIRCEYWWNADDFSMPFSSSKIRTAWRKPRKSRIG